VPSLDELNDIWQGGKVSVPARQKDAAFSAGNGAFKSPGSRMTRYDLGHPAPPVLDADSDDHCAHMIA
jgi:hypothetical protein